KEKPVEDSKAQYLKRLKHLVVLAGLRFNYKKMFDGVEDDKKRISLLKQALSDKGVTTLSAEGCKNFRLKREEEQELAELSGNRIIEPETSWFFYACSSFMQQIIKGSLVFNIAGMMI
ncbi:hypothetical protein Tcan_02157, partial [Toxocara canis]